MATIRMKHANTGEIRDVSDASEELTKLRQEVTQDPVSGGSKPAWEKVGEFPSASAADADDYSGRNRLSPEDFQFGDEANRALSAAEVEAGLTYEQKQYELGLGPKPGSKSSKSKSSQKEEDKKAGTTTGSSEKAAEHGSGGGSTPTSQGS